MKTLRCGEFSVELLRGLPGDSPLPLYQFARQFARPKQSTHSEGTVIRVTGPDRQWIGNFQSGHCFGEVTDLFVFHSQRSICLISGGQGYQVNPASPEFYTLMDFHIFGARYVSESDRLIVWDLTRIAAYSPNGLQWITGRVSWDGIAVSEINPEFINGFAWDAINDVEVSFKVRMSDGQHTGGAKNLPS